MCVMDDFKEWPAFLLRVKGEQQFELPGFESTPETVSHPATPSKAKPPVAKLPRPEISRSIIPLPEEFQPEEV